MAKWQQIGEDTDTEEQRAMRGRLTKLVEHLSAPLRYYAKRARLGFVLVVFTDEYSEAEGLSATAAFGSSSAIDGVLESLASAKIGQQCTQADGRDRRGDN